MGGKTLLINTPSEITIARWPDRFLAWLVDFAIVSSALGVFFAISHFTSPPNHSHTYDSLAFFGYLAFFVYWIILEYKYSQSLGKKILNLRTTNLDGSTPNLKNVLVNNFGKAFLLPIDVILGLILTNKKRQRIFNKLSDTVVIKVDEKEQNTSYRFD